MRRFLGWGSGSGKGNPGSSGSSSGNGGHDKGQSSRYGGLPTLGNRQKRQEVERRERELEELRAVLRRKEELEEKERTEKEAIRSERAQELERRRGMVMDITEQSSEKFDLNQGTMGLVDRLNAHHAGKLLKNVVISNEAPPDREVNLARLRRFRPQNDFSKLTLGDIPPIPLTEGYTELPIVDAMTERQFRELKNYVLVSDIFIHYIPLDSFFSVSNPIQFILNDFRKTDNTKMREYPLSHAGGYNILMTLDYCVAKADLKNLVLTISTNLSSFRKGTQWAACKILLTVSHMDFPVKANMQETMGVLHMADSDLQDFISDPRSSDGVITPEAFRLLKEHYRRGEIENINLPSDDMKEVNVARTVAGAAASSSSIRDLMAGMRDRSSESRTPLKSSLKGKGKEVVSRPYSPPEVLDEEEEEARRETLRQGDREDDGILPGDSLSDAGSGETFDLPRNDLERKANFRNVGF